MKINCDTKREVSVRGVPSRGMAEHSLTVNRSSSEILTAVSNKIFKYPSNLNYLAVFKSTAGSAT